MKVEQAKAQMQRLQMDYFTPLSSFFDGYIDRISIRRKSGKPQAY